MLTKTIKQKNVLKETGKKNINPRFKIHGILRREDTKKKEIPKSWQAAKRVLRKKSVNPWLKIHGILKNKKIIDPVKWQNKIREESDRNLKK